MRILMLTHNMAGLGGSFMRAFSLAKSLVKIGKDVTLIASRREPGMKPVEKDWNGVRVIQAADILPERVRHGGLSLLDILGRVEHVKQVHYDVIHCFDHRFAASIPALLLRRWRRIPYITDWADLWGREGIAGQRRAVARVTLGRIDHFWEASTRKKADLITVITNDLAARAHALGISPAKIKLLPVVANVEEIRPLPKAAMRLRYGFPQDAHILVHTGFSPYDISLLSRMFVLLAERDRSAILLTTGGRFAQMDEIISAAGFAGRTHYMGVLPFKQLQEVMACGDIMLMPFRNSSLNRARYPNRFGDYLAAGRPVVSNPTGDLGQVMQTEKIGILVEETPQAFAEGIQALLDAPHLLEEMGQNARHLAETRFSGPAIGKTLFNLYQTLVTS